MSATLTSKDIDERYANKHIARWNDDKFIDIEKLYPTAATKEIIEEDVLMFGASRSPRSGFSQKRYDAADTKYPIITYKDEYGYVILDGRHRYLKQLDSGAEKVKIVELSIEEIERCVVE